MFKPYTKLKRILMKKNIQILLTSTAGSLTRKEELQEIFKHALIGLDSLEYLEMNECYLGDWVSVYLPYQLKILNFDKNRYHKIDVHWASDLEELSAKENYLENIPKLSVPSPPLKILRLNENPLNEMTVTDVAQLCEITLLELQFSDQSFYVSEAGYCQCLLLKKWANETELKGVENVKCFDGGNSNLLTYNYVARDIWAEIQYTCLALSRYQCTFVLFQQINQNARKSYWKRLGIYVRNVLC